ncbi:hypothetical protein NIES3974_05420 [Calothrix sp. NIES-3974]|nr:hypothetical protein NIES3974_05420 [Calothrix sp. NIES-3974]
MGFCFVCMQFSPGGLHLYDVVTPPSAIAIPYKSSSSATFKGGVDTQYGKAHTLKGVCDFQNL